MWVRIKTWDTLHWEAMEIHWQHVQDVKQQNLNEYWWPLDLEDDRDEKNHNDDHIDDDDDIDGN